MSLGALITGYFRRREKVADGRKRERMAQDKAAILDVGTWPLVVLCALKTQPWRRINGPMSMPDRYGDIWLGDLQAGEFIVRDKRDQSRVFDSFGSIDDLVEEWSID